MDNNIAPLPSLTAHPIGLPRLRRLARLLLWLALLAYFKPLAHIGHMPHWAADADAAERLAGAVENDH